jgi:hypothetical protein
MAEGTASWPEDMMDGLTPAQHAVMQPPYANRLDRPVLAEAKAGDGGEGGGAGGGGEQDVVVQSRSAAKKAWDATVFKNTYF